MTIAETPTRMQVLAHRGASADAPENTLEAFEEAIRQDADGLEFDVRVCGSGEVVVFHDDCLSRLANLPWKIRYTPWWKLRRIDVATRLGFKPAHVPLLADVVAAVPTSCILNIELKCDVWDDRGLSIKVADYVVRCRLEERVIISSFNPLCLARVAARAPHLKRGLLINPDASFMLQNCLLAPWCSNFSMHLSDVQVTADQVLQWRRRGWRTAGWTVDDPERALELSSMGIDYCITNRPGQIKKRIQLQR